MFSRRKISTNELYTFRIRGAKIDFEVLIICLVFFKKTNILLNSSLIFVGSKLFICNINIFRDQDIQICSLIEFFVYIEKIKIEYYFVYKEHYNILKINICFSNQNLC
jgi:hypothetical protein